MAKYSGGCACGSVRYEIKGEPVVNGHCQCSKCRHLSGCGHSDMMFFMKDQVELTGNMASWSYVADSGANATRHFCPKCGSPIAGTGDGAPMMMGITAGTLDDPAAYKPQVVVFSRPEWDWDLMAAELPRFPGMPPA